MSRSAEVATEPIAIGSRRKLFVDRSLIERLDRTSLKLHEPAGPVGEIRLDGLEGMFRVGSHCKTDSDCLSSSTKGQTNR